MITYRFAKLGMMFATTMLALSGCVGSLQWYASHPDKQKVVINDREWSVVPRGNNQYDVISFGAFFIRNQIQMKHDQIKAVELVTKCKVIEADQVNDSVVLQTIVKCK